MKIIKLYLAKLSATIIITNHQQMSEQVLNREQICILPTYLKKRYYTISLKSETFLYENT